MIKRFQKQIIYTLFIMLIGTLFLVNCTPEAKSGKGEDVTNNVIPYWTYNILHFNVRLLINTPEIKKKLETDEKVVLDTLKKNNIDIFKDIYSIDLVTNDLKDKSIDEIFANVSSRNINALKNVKWAIIVRCNIKKEQSSKLIKKVLSKRKIKFFPSAYSGAVIYKLPNFKTEIACRDNLIIYSTSKINKEIISLADGKGKNITDREDNFQRKIDKIKSDVPFWGVMYIKGKFDKFKTITSMLPSIKRAEYLTITYEMKDKVNLILGVSFPDEKSAKKVKETLNAAIPLLMSYVKIPKSSYDIQFKVVENEVVIDIKLDKSLSKTFLPV